MLPLAVFDVPALSTALDERRRADGLDWYGLAGELWQQSSVLNAELGDHPLCGGAVSRQGARDTMSCQYALYMLRWLDRAPEEFLRGPVAGVGDVALPPAGPGARLRFDLAALHAAVDEQRTAQGLTWAALATAVGCTTGRLTNLRTARLAEIGLVMRLTQWLGRPAAAFIRPSAW